MSEWFFVRLHRLDSSVWFNVQTPSQVCASLVFVVWPGWLLELSFPKWRTVKDTPND